MNYASDLQLKRETMITSKKYQMDRAEHIRRELEE